jgi:hypothetical protein
MCEPMDEARLYHQEAPDTGNCFRRNGGSYLQGDRSKLGEREVRAPIQYRKIF